MMRDLPLRHSRKAPSSLPVEPAKTVRKSKTLRRSGNSGSLRPDQVLFGRPKSSGVRFVDPGVPGEPGVIGAADRAMGAFEKHRAAPKALAIGLDACGDRASGLRAIDHDHTHVSLPWIWFLSLFGTRNRPVGSRLLSVRLLGGHCAPARCLIEHGDGCSWRGLVQPAGSLPLERTLDVNSVPLFSG